MQLGSAWKPNKMSEMVWAVRKSSNSSLPIIENNLKCRKPMNSKSQFKKRSFEKNNKEKKV
jgi:CRISPR/Cas system CSM-associated protein Csm4 (group 5 of RAMP superfamily)